MLIITTFGLNYIEIVGVFNLKTLRLVQDSCCSQRGKQFLPKTESQFMLSFG
jgi:hypothetical protein